MDLMRQYVSDATPCMAMSHDTIRWHTWAEKRRNKVALCQMCLRVLDVATSRRLSLGGPLCLPCLYRFQSIKRYGSPCVPRGIFPCPLPHIIFCLCCKLPISGSCGFSAFFGLDSNHGRHQLLLSLCTHRFVCFLFHIMSSPGSNYSLPVTVFFFRKSAVLYTWKRLWNTAARRISSAKK